jgi:hypothetical protein
MVNNQKINKFYKKKYSPKRGKNKDGNEMESPNRNENEDLQPPNVIRKESVNSVSAIMTQQSSLAKASLQEEGKAQSMSVSIASLVGMEGGETKDRNANLMDVSIDSEFSAESSENILDQSVARKAPRQDNQEMTIAAPMHKPLFQIRESPNSTSFSMLTVTDMTVDQEKDNMSGDEDANATKTVTVHVDKRSKDAVEELQEVFNIKPRYSPEPPKVVVRGPHLQYYDVRVPVRPSKEGDDSWDIVIKAFKALMAELWGADPSIKIFPYLAFNRESNNTYLDSVISFKNLSRENFTDFFHGGYPLFAGGMRTCQILMTHSKPFKDLVRNVSHYLQRVKAGFFKKSLQTELSMSIGWAYMSTSQMDRDLLAEQLSYLLGIPVGLQWRMIFTERPPEGITEKDKVRAIHFEVEDNDVPYAKKALAELYHHNKLEGFPLGIRLRFVPDFQRVTYSQDKDKIRELIGMQQTFQDKIGHTASSDIWSIDAKLPDGRSLREYMMNMKVDNELSKPLFVAINPDPKGLQYLFFPQFRDEATSTLMHLLVRLRSEYPEARKTSLDKLFDRNARERADETKWDPVTKKATAPESVYIGGILDAAKSGDRLYAFADDIQKAKTTTPKPNNAAVDDLTVGDVSTIATSKSLSGKGESKQRKILPRSETGQKIVAFDDDDSFASCVNSVAQSATQSMASIVTTAELDQKLRQQSLELEKKVIGQIDEVRLQQMAMHDKQQQQFEAQQRQFEIQQQQFEALQKILAGRSNPTSLVNTNEIETISTLTPTHLAAPAHADESGQLSL